jgi:Flp pilus assembly protein TadG
MSARRDRGTATTELVILTPLVLIIMLFAVVAGRMVNAKLDIDSAARQAARAATLARDPGSAAAAARTTATAVLSDRHIACTATSVSVDTTAFRPGGHVEVSVTCQIALSTVSGFGLPGDKRYRSSFVSPLDPWREISP